MGSNYNSRPLAGEILVSGKKAAVVRQRQDLNDVWADERLATWQ
jgi:diaminopimelate decarboxylase